MGSTGSTGSTGSKAIKRSQPLPGKFHTSQISQELQQSLAKQRLAAR